MIKVFISHSSRDKELAEYLVHLIKDALELSAIDIRCTSVDGYRLPGGTNTEAQLKTEVSNSVSFIGLISKASLNSTYVIFELGARWGANKSLIPLLAPGIEPSDLKGPISSLNALSCSNIAQLHQLVTELASTLQIQIQSAAQYQTWIDKIINYKSKYSEKIESVKSDLNISPENVSQKHLANESYQDILQQIKSDAEHDHPNDFSTQKYVIDEQVSAFKQIENFSDPDVPKEILETIFHEAAQDHPNDFSTQLYVIVEQINSWKELNH